MHIPKISVVLPVFNSENFISSAIDSILNQTFQDFELIVINDGSTDSTAAIVENYRKKDSRVKVIGRENKGLIFSLNEGVARATGEWVARMDADDISHPRRFEIQIKYAIENSADICGCAVEYIGTVHGVKRFYPLADDGIKMALAFGCPIAHPSVLLRRAVVDQCKYNIAAKLVEDYDLWIRLAMNNFKFVNCNEILLQYRIHNSQISSKNRVDQVNKTYALMDLYARWYYENHIKSDSFNTLSSPLSSKSLLDIQKEIVGHGLAFNIKNDILIYIGSFVPYTSLTIHDLYKVLSICLELNCFRVVPVMKLIYSLIVGRLTYAKTVNLLK